MLIEFNVTNYRSIRETQTLSMVSSKHYKEFEESNCFDSKLRGFSKLLRAGAIYGPNASGKSNLLRAIHFMRRFILNSQSYQERQPIDVEPFAFSNDTRSEPSEFEIFFVQDNVRFQYGFAVNKMRVVKENLFAYPEGKAQRWFERNNDDYKFGSKFSGQRQLWRDATRQNALFLSTAIQLNSEQLKPVFNWFKLNIIVIGMRGFLPDFSIEDCDSFDECYSDEGKKKRILEFMISAGIGISDIEVRNTSLEMELKGELTDTYVKHFKDIEFKHQGTNGDPVYLDLKDESLGTRKLFEYAGTWLNVLAKGRVIIIDELDNSLHLLLVHYLISLIQNQNTNKNNAQLIFTTHNTSLLDTKIFRRDQIWFVERDRENASKLYPLSEFSARKGEAIAKNYLTGRYGALPHIEDLNF